MNKTSWQKCLACLSFNPPTALECKACGVPIKPAGFSTIVQKPLEILKKPEELRELGNSSRTFLTCSHCGHNNPVSVVNCRICKHVIKVTTSDSLLKTSNDDTFLRRASKGRKEAPVEVLNWPSTADTVARARSLGGRLAKSSGNPWADQSKNIQSEVANKIRQTLTEDIRDFSTGLRKIAARQATHRMAWFYGAAVILNSLAYGIKPPDSPTTLLAGIIWSLILTWIMHQLYRRALIESKMKAPRQDIEAGVTAGVNQYKEVLRSLQYANTEGAKRPKAEVSSLNPRAAENFCAAWLVSLGHSSAEVTRFSRDGGVDVQSENIVAQVKHQKTDVGVKPIRELHGVSSALKKRAVFFTLTGYSLEAIEFANSVEMPLFVYRNNDLHPCNKTAQLFASGILKL